MLKQLIHELKIQREREKEKGEREREREKKRKRKKEWKKEEDKERKKENNIVGILFVAQTFKICLQNYNTLKKCFLKIPICSLFSGSNKPW